MRALQKFKTPLVWLVVIALFLGAAAGFLGSVFGG